MKKTTSTNMSSLKLKLNRETIQNLEEGALHEVAGASYYCHSGVSVTYCCSKGTC
jgi:hypothetical protein